MKKLLIILLFPVFLIAQRGEEEILISYQKAPVLVTTILIDYDDGTAGNSIHDAAINNGGFEATTGSIPAFVNWVKVGAKNLAVQTNLNSPNGAGNNVIIARDGGGFSSPGQDTGHVIALDDKFSASYAWRDAWNWGAGKTIDVTLYYTDTNLIGGARTILFSFNSADETSNNTWENETLALTAGVADAAAVGKTLFFAFEGNNLGNNSFARLDNVYLDVTHLTTPLP